MEKALNYAGIKFSKDATAGLYSTSIQLESFSKQQLDTAQKFYDAWLNSENEYYHASENGLKKTYTIEVTRERELNSNNQLSGIVVSGFSISPAF